MSGYPEYNFPRFNERAAEWRKEGWEVVNPAEIDDGDTSKPWEYYMRKDLADILTVDAVAVLPNWQASRGATLEVAVARALGLPILDAGTFAPYDETALQESQRLVHGERNASYGHPLDDYTTTAALWSAVLGHPVTAEQAILCMILVKVSRESRIHKRDNCVDIAGYAECLNWAVDERKRRAS